MRNRRGHTVPRRKTFQRAHLLGSSFRACAARASGFIEAPGSGSRDRKEGGGSYSAVQPDNGTRWEFAPIVSAWRESVMTNSATHSAIIIVELATTQGLQPAELAIHFGDRR